MKKIILLVCLSLLQFSCEKPPSVIDLPTTDKEMLTSDQLILYEKAHDLFYDNISVFNGRFIITVHSGESIGVSEKLFNYFKDKVYQTNQQISTLETYGGKALIKDENKVFVSFDENINTKSDASDLRFCSTCGGASGMLYYEDSTEVWICNCDLQAMSYSCSVVSWILICCSVLNPAVLFDGLVLEGASLGLEWAVITYPKGVMYRINYYQFYAQY